MLKDHVPFHRQTAEVYDKRTRERDLHRLQKKGGQARHEARSGSRVVRPAVRKFLSRSGFCEEAISE